MYSTRTSRECERYSRMGYPRMRYLCWSWYCQRTHFTRTIPHTGKIVLKMFSHADPPFYRGASLQRSVLEVFLEEPSPLMPGNEIEGYLYNSIYAFIYSFGAVGLIGLRGFTRVPPGTGDIGTKRLGLSNGITRAGCRLACWNASLNVLRHDSRSGYLG